MILARNTLIPKQGRKSRHLAFPFLGFFGWDLKHSTRASLSMPEMTHSSLLGREIPKQGSPEGFSAGLPNRRGHGGTDKASFSLILCLGRAANKATSNLHTTRRLIPDSQGGSIGPRIEGGGESLPLWEMKGLRSESSFTLPVLLAPQVQLTD